jgi:hypothetical protein
MQSSPRFLVVLAAILLLTCLSAYADDVAPSPLNGTWLLNKDLSDDPATVFGMPPGGGGGEMPSGGGRGGGMGGGGGRGGGMGGGPMSDNPPGKSHDRAKRPDMEAGRARLIIFAEAEEFVVTDANEIVRTLYTDGRACETWTDRGKLDEKAQIVDGEVVVVSRDERGGARTTVYAYDPEADLLTVRVSLTPPGSKTELTLRSVYARAAD